MKVCALSVCVFFRAVYVFFRECVRFSSRVCTFSFESVYIFFREACTFSFDKDKNLLLRTSLKNHRRRS